MQAQAEQTRTSRKPVYAPHVGDEESTRTEAEDARMIVMRFASPTTVTGAGHDFKDSAVQVESGQRGGGELRARGLRLKTVTAVIASLDANGRRKPRTRRPRARLPS